MRKKIIIVATILLIAVSLSVGTWATLRLGAKEEINRFTYPLLVGEKTYNITVETNWTGERAPSVSLLNSSDNRYPIELYFLGGTQEKNISYTITIPTDLVWGNISLVWKYYLQDSNRYTLSNNGTHNSLQMTFAYQPFFSGSGYFEILGTEGAW
jgi:hypothetical protein